MNIKDIAKLANVSIATVSRVINGTAYVSPKTKEKIDKIIKESGYKPNLLAREFVKSKSNTIGVVLPRIDLATFSLAVQGISNYFKDKGYSIILINTQSNLELEDELSYFDFLEKKRVAGVIYFATEVTDQHIDVLKKVKYPVVFLGQSNKKLNLPCVKYDHFNAARSVVKYLIENGHKRIACLSVKYTNYEFAKLRKEGYISALRENNIEIDEEIICDGDWEMTSTVENVKEIMKNSKNKPTAFFTVSYRKAMATIYALTEQGYKIPEDFSVVGVDECEESKYYSPSITTACFDNYYAGEKAAELMLNIIENKTIEENEILINYKLSIRKSVAKI
ncbi:LacI family DNA-binding transcriptional regulator [uncultured Ilyobacter sp.]|uniref:LacI family DNA-binding transcriptional regulator n=1 Tax=uncultured Ilyobacter sp. TaxID=544433 RepID=UPI0029C00C72|nr:LacI family DNA-binding transcriptional regulator [uncultured Ilyobacter sp.]